MYKRTTTVTTMVPVKVDFFPVDLSDSADEDSVPSLAEFEVDGVIIANRKLYSERDWEICDAVFDEPVSLHLMVGEDTEGNLSAFLSALVPLELSPEDAWLPSIPHLESETPTCPFPLGVLFRAHWTRLYPNDLGEEAKAMLNELVSVPLTEETERAVEVFLRSL